MEAIYLDARGNPRRPRVFVAMPTYGQVHAGAMRGLYESGTRAEVTPQLAGVSLLGHCFDMLWATMLNTLPQKRYDYFAMLHSDVDPEPPRDGSPGWLDVLLGEAEATGADVVSAVVPIKDPRGVTSTAVCSGDEYRPTLRLTMRQVMLLPETFSAADAGFPGSALLVNTGCWICRVAGQEWVHDFPGFEIRNRIVRLPDGTCQAQVAPEDWRASRWWHSKGLKVLATRKVKLHHCGGAFYGNQSAWGQWGHDRDLDAQAAEELTRRLGGSP